MNRSFASLVLVLGLLIAWASTPTASAEAGIPLLEGKGGVPSLAPLLEKVTPAVVNIAVLSRAPAEENPLFRDPYFRFFFDSPERPPAQPQMSAGSGVIVDAETGYVLTNNHVIENADEIMVTLKDRRRFKAELVGTDPGTDIALLRIEPDNLTAIGLGDSDALQVGDFVVAIGNPFGLGQTVTSGIVSALGRSGLNVEGYEDFIQTDASINPGNSGGALVSLKGELIGVNTAIIGPSGGNVGIGFAVPSNMAGAVMVQLVRFGEVRRGRLGVAVQDLTPDLAEALGLSETGGAVVTQVEPASPAGAAGIRAADVIVTVDGRPVRGSTDLRNAIGLRPIGTDAVLGVIRDGAEVTIRVRVGKVEPGAAAAPAPTSALAGARFADIDRASPLFGAIKGAAVATVEPGSPAWRNGLRQGDVVVAVNRRPVPDASELQRALEAGGPTIALNVIRDGNALLIVVR